jgi:outer membrane protein
LKIALLFLLALNLIAQDDYSLRLAYGNATKSTLGDVLVGDIEPYPYDMSVIALDGGYLLKEKALQWPLDIYLKGGFSYFDDSDYSDAASASIYEITLYVKAYWNFDFLSNRIRLGVGEGVSYTSDILTVEYLEDPTENKSNILNYIDISADFDFGRLINYEPMYGTYIGWALKHRSGIFGLINGVTSGGSNYNTLYLEKTF